MDALAEIANLLKDPQNEMSIGSVIETELSEDRSVLRAKVSLWPDLNEVIARVTWDSIGPNAGLFQFPQPNDLVLIAFPEKEVEDAIILKRFSSKQDTIPQTAVDGSTVLRSLDQFKLWLTSATRVNISRGDNEPTENLVIGQVFKATYIDHFNKLIELIERLIVQRETDANHTHYDGFGIPTSPPIQAPDMQTEKSDLEDSKSKMEDIKSSKVESEAILSDYSFTEK